MNDFNVTVWSSNHLNDVYNCEYPYMLNAKNEDMFKKCVSKDHTFIAFRNNYRANENFIYTDTLVVDCDNTHSEDENEWIKFEDVAAAFPDVRFIAYTSRNHMKRKNGKQPRPRFHVIFFAERIENYEDYKHFVEKVVTYFPYFDSKAQDAARFFYGNPDTKIFIQDGLINLSQFFDEDDFAKMDREIHEGSRNDSMFKWAVRSMKRYGNTDESKECFFREAEKCVPPLDDRELHSIWRSAEKYYKRIAKQPGYVSPKEYNNPKLDKWVDPIPFDKFTTAKFPIDSFPKDIADYIVSVAESTQTTVDMAGALAISVLSTCLQCKYRVQGKADWLEPLNTYVLAVAAPSERKSAVLQAMLKPLNDYEVQYNRRNAALVENNKMQKKVLERRQKILEEQAAKGKVEQSELQKIAQEVANFREIKPLQLYVDDITTEKLVSVLAKNKGRAALISSEGGIFDTLAGIYTRNVNIDVMLKGYSGDTIRVDRIGRESESVMNPALTILLMAQPNVISDVMNNATFRGRGLTARFLYCMPISEVGRRKFKSNSVATDVYLEYERKIINLLEDKYSEKPEIIKLTVGAENLLESFSNELEPKLLNEFAEIADWVGKLVGNTLRIAGLLCRASVYRADDFLSVPESLFIDEITMEKAIKLSRYFLNHAQAIFSVLPEDAMSKKAEKILKMIKTKGFREFDRREAMRNCRSFKKVADIQPVLDYLEDYGYIFAQPENAPTTGRTRLSKYYVNPKILED